MYFPKYWAKASVTGPNRDGDTTTLEAWGWSDSGNDDARQRATARAQTSLSRATSQRDKRGQYYQDGDRPFREPILESTRQGNIELIITRNRLGCEVLNVESVGFADIDYDAPRPSLFKSLFGGRKKREAHRADWENQTLDSLRNWQQGNPSWSFRAYRTAGGLRLLATSKIIPAGSPESESWLQSVGSDPLYIKLCRTHKSFRARLSPKPWRCGCDRFDVLFPFETEQAAAKAADWIVGYQQKSCNFAVCQFLVAIGSATLPELKSAIALHDDRTRATSSLPLA